MFLLWVVTHLTPKNLTPRGSRVICIICPSPKYSCPGHNSVTAKWRILLGHIAHVGPLRGNLV